MAASRYRLKKTTMAMIEVLDASTATPRRVKWNIIRKFMSTKAMGSFISVALVSLPALNAFRKLAISMDKLSKVVSEEVPGTLSSLKLSSLEINDLTSQLKYLRQRISGSQSGEKIRASKRRSHRGRI